ncbi:MAG: acyl-CoA thioesterase [Chlorobi bacterium]|nr:acyl-CoA thioesterase [Chlorobiota bacterium]
MNDDQSFHLSIRTRYAETDQMGYIHHGVYPVYLELARIEWLKTFGISYKQMEINGILLPVYQMKIKYFKPLTFDQEIKVYVRLKTLRGPRLQFAYEIRDENNVKTTEATVELVFTNRRGKPIRPPKEIVEKLNGNREI